MELRKEEIKRGRKMNRQIEENQLINELTTFLGKRCKICLTSDNSSYPELESRTGEIKHINNNGVLIEENDKPIFLSWNVIRTIELDRMDIKPPDWH